MTQRSPYSAAIATKVSSPPGVVEQQPDGGEEGCLVPDGKAPVSAKRQGPPASFRGQRGAISLSRTHWGNRVRSGGFQNAPPCVHDTDALNFAKRRRCDAVGISLGSAAHC
jgi:hypothetical protein